LSSELVCCEGFVSSCGENFESGFDGREIGIGDNGGEGTGFETHHEEEGGFSGYRMGAMIVGELRLGDQIGPCGGVVSTKDPEVGLDLLIDTFSFSVCLRVISGGKGEVVSEDLSEFFGKGRGELWTAIGDDLVVESEAFVNFVEEKGGYPFGGDGFLGRTENYPLRKPVVDHDQ
jgi:hypothetical protein